MRAALAVLLIASCVSADRPEELPAECVPREPEPPPSDDDVRPVPEIEYDPEWTLPVYLPRDARCAQELTFTSTVAIDLRWSRDGQVYQELVSARQDVELVPSGDQCLVMATTTLVPGSAAAFPLVWDSEVSVCSAAVLHPHWATFADVPVTLSRFAVHEWSGPAHDLPVQRTLPWAEADDQLGCSDAPTSGSIPNMTPTFSTIVAIPSSDWRRLHSPAAKLVAIRLRIDG